MNGKRKRIERYVSYLIVPIVIIATGLLISGSIAMIILFLFFYLAGILASKVIEGLFTRHDD